MVILGLDSDASLEPEALKGAQLNVIRIRLSENGSFPFEVFPGVIMHPWLLASMRAAKLSQ